MIESGCYSLKLSKKKKNLFKYIKVHYKKLINLSLYILQYTMKFLFLNKELRKIQLQEDFCGKYNSL